MRPRVLLVFGLVIALLALQAPQNNVLLAQKKAPKKKGPKIDPDITLSQLSLEVSALQGLYRFQMTQPQMEALTKLAAETAKADKRGPGKGSDKLRKRLLDLREALVDGDEERIGDLEEKLADLLDEEEPDLDDRVTISPQALRPARDFLKTIRPPQIVSYLSDSAEDIRDPLATLIDVLDVAPVAKEAEWNDLASEMAEELKWQLGGMDPEKNKTIGAKVEGYLKRIRGLTEKEIDAKRTELEKAAEDIVAETPSAIILQNYVEHALAELLCNPRLPAALEARMEKESK
jgi:hypothetical protein